MTTFAEVVRQRYAKHLIEFGRSGGYISRETALFALQMALYDLEEVWKDEYTSLEQRVAVATETATENGREVARMNLTVEALRAGLQQVMVENDALEAECVRLRGMTNGSLSAMSAETGSPEPGASSTSKPTVLMHRSPVVSSSENGAAAGHASSAGTSKRRGVKVRSENGEIVAREVGEMTGLDPTPSPHLHGARTLLDNHHDLDRQIGFLAEGKNQWRQYSRPMRLAILAYLWEEQWSKVSEFDRTRPAWMPTGGALVFLSTDNRWSQIQQSISELRALPSVSS